MNNRIFNPEKYGMAICPCCNSHGYIQNPERQCCPKCGGFGFIKKEGTCLFKKRTAALGGQWSREGIEND